VNLNAPKKIVWMIAVILGILGILGYLIPIPVVTGLAFWLVTVGFVLLVLGTTLKGF